MRLYGTTDEGYALEVGKKSGWEYGAGSGLLRIPKGESTHRRSRAGDEADGDLDAAKKAVRGRTALEEWTTVCGHVYELGRYA